ncbi:flavin reductase family protein [Pseudomonas amygdali]|uniref:flavin reductase family protein n=1 Tax=Pseudomonas amygdali TaxID=47877 RepID=UPI002180427E|nr:flavin reductase family protein [Pseudomonas amygdali]
MTAVTTAGEKIGLTANSFSSVSLSPQLVQVSIARSLRSFPLLSEVESFAINLLSEDQLDLCMRFAKQGEDKWQGLEVEPSEAGAVLLPGRLGHFDCRVWARYDGGDHLILVGEVLNYHVCPNAAPLLFYKGCFQQFAKIA